MHPYESLIHFDQKAKESFLHITQGREDRMFGINFMDDQTDYRESPSILGIHITYQYTPYSLRNH